MTKGTKNLAWTILFFVIAGIFSATDGVQDGFQGYLHWMAFVMFFAGIATLFAVIGALWNHEL